MAQKDLKAKVTLDVKSANAKLDALAKHINKVNQAVNRTSAQAGKMTNALNRTIPKITQAQKATDKLANSASRVTKNYQKSGTAVSALTKKVKSLAAAYLGVMGARAIIGTSDAITSAQNKLNYVNGGNKNLTQENMDKTYAAAQRSRGGYMDMIGNVSKSMVLAGDAFQNNVDNAIRFQEIMSKAYTVGGASAAEQSSSMYQMVQALGSGILQGDELRSVREGAPIAYKEIEKFAQGVLHSEESLKELASQGKITSDMVVAAIMNAGDKIDSAFEDTAMTFGQAFNQIKNLAVKAFEPVLTTINEVLNSDAGTAMLNGIALAITGLAKAINWIIGLLGSFFNWFADNWYWLQWIVYAVIIAITAYLAIMAVQAIWAGLQAFWAFITGMSPLYLWIIMIGIVVGALVWLANTTSTACEFMVGALLVVAAAILLIGIITGSTVLLVIAAVLAGLALLLLVFMQYGEQITSFIYQCGAFIYNLVVGVLDGILQAGYTLFVEPWIGIIEWFVNAFNGGFNGILGAAANAIGQLVSMFLSGLKVITKAIDAVAGTSFTDKIGGWQDSVKSWGKNSNAVTYSVEAPTVSALAGALGLNLPDRISYSEAGALGAKHGAIAQNALNNFGTSMKDKIAGLGDFSLGGLTSDTLANTFGLGKGGAYDPSNALDVGIPNPYDPANSAGGSYDPSKALKNIDGNTGKMADSMELAEEDLEYLYKLAEMEWKKEYTTANITLDVTNNNNVNSELDVFGIANKISEVLWEEVDYMANGVYA